jgi:hypothetical protein
MSGEPLTSCLSGEQVAALKFAVHRQLARWSNKPKLSPSQQWQRAALKSVVRVLHDQAFAHGCELRVPDAPDDGDD